MLSHPQVDVLISNDLGVILSNYASIHKITRLPQFEKWKNGLIPSFTFGDVHMLIRRSSLAIIGLYNISYTMMDWEYSLRISYLKANIAYYTGYNALNVSHPDTVTAQRNIPLIEMQAKRAEVFYEYEGDQAEISNWSRFKIFVGKTLNYDKNKAHNRKPTGNESTDIDTIYSHFYSYISKINDSEEFKFL
jgi:hypothetical protein